MTKYLRTTDGHEFVYTPDMVITDNRDTPVTDALAVTIQASAALARIVLLVSDAPFDAPVEAPSVDAATYATRDYVASYVAAHAPSAPLPYVGPTPPADPTLPWIDTGSVFTTDIRTSLNTINVVQSGTVTVTLGATPNEGSLLVVRNRGGTTPQLTPGTLDVGSRVLFPGEYTLTTNTLVLPNSVAGDSYLIRYNYPSASGTSAAQAISDQPFIVDSFDRANSATTLGATDTGQAWSVPLDYLGAQPVFGVTGNLAYPVTNTNNRAFALVDTGRVDYTVQAKITFTAGTAVFGLAIASDTTGSNSYTSNLTALAKWVNGTASTILTYANGYLTGDTMRVTRKGDKLTVYRQVSSVGEFVFNGEVTDAANHGTRTGLNARATWTTVRWDDFKVYAA